MTKRPHLLLLGLTALARLLLAQRSLFTSLVIDNHPCKPENLKGQLRYICTENGTVTCNNGWSNVNDNDPLHPCLTPVCNPPCVHGTCNNPNLCACRVGWEGNDCNTCIPRPGCVHGTCNQTALVCECTDPTKWSGGLCNIPVCNNCVNGRCVAPGVCLCNQGWQGPTCSACVASRDCNPIGGSCVDPSNPSRQIPDSCICKQGFTGPLCNRPDCSPPCTAGRGTCVFAYSNNTHPICRCNLGWTTASCKECIPYPGCPKGYSAGGCSEPFECKCDPGDTDPVCWIHQTFAKGR